MNMLETISHLPASSPTLQKYREAQKNDPLCQQLIMYCKTGWPSKREVDSSVKPYWDYQGELTVGEELLLRGNRLVVPRELQTETLKKLHEGHQGIVKCRLRANTAVWWPGLSKQMSEFIKKCPECSRESIPHKEPLIPTTLPDYPWQKVATDLFTHKGDTYIVIVDYFSRYPEICRVQPTTSQSVVTAMKSVFSRHGIPETVVSDNGPQYTSEEFTDFAHNYQFTHVTSSPHYPSSNGQAERAVQTAKHLLKNAEDPSLALLSYRSTPLPWCGKSPAELLMGRSIRSTLPLTKNNLIPEWSYIPQFKKDNEVFKQNQKRDHDQRHRVKSLPAIPDNTDVWVTSGSNPVPGTTVTSADTPRSYIIQTQSGDIRRNRRHLNIRHDSKLTTAATDLGLQRPKQTRSQTGTAIRPPDRLA